MGEPAGNVLPIYFESGSMSGDIGELNRGLVSLLDELLCYPMAASKVRFCVMGFADDAVSYLEPADLRDVEAMPTLSARGSTSYAAAFRALHQRIPNDVRALKGQNYLVNRPAVFFLTDGAPNPGDGWERSHADLTDPGFGPRPNILAFGIGKADGDVIKRVATSPQYAFITAKGTDTGVAIAEFLT